jgi:hypothetical protein
MSSQSIITSSPTHNPIQHAARIGRGREGHAGDARGIRHLTALPRFLQEDCLDRGDRVTGVRDAR